MTEPREWIAGRLADHKACRSHREVAAVESMLAETHTDLLAQLSAAQADFLDARETHHQELAECAAYWQEKLSAAQAEVDQLRKVEQALNEKVMRYDHEVGQAQAEVERLKSLLASEKMAGDYWCEQFDILRAKMNILSLERDALRTRAEQAERKYHEAMAILSEWDNIDKAEAIGRAQRFAQALADKERESERLRESLTALLPMAQTLQYYRERGSTICFDNEFEAEAAERVAPILAIARAALKDAGPQ